MFSAHKLLSIRKLVSGGMILAANNFPRSKLASVVYNNDLKALNYWMSRQILSQALLKDQEDVLHVQKMGEKDNICSIVLEFLQSGAHFFWFLGAPKIQTEMEKHKKLKIKSTCFIKLSSQIQYGKIISSIYTSS